MLSPSRQPSPSVLRRTISSAERSQSDPTRATPLLQNAGDRDSSVVQTEPDAPVLMRPMGSRCGTNQASSAIMHGAFAPASTSAAKPSSNRPRAACEPVFFSVSAASRRIDPTARLESLVRAR